MSGRIQTFSTYEVAVIIPSVAAGKFLAHISFPNIPPPPIERQIGISRIRLVQESAALGEYGLIRCLTAGTPTAAGTHPGLLVSQGNGGWVGPLSLPPQSQGIVTSAWTVDPAPVAPAVYYEMDLLDPAVGERFEWTWPEDNPFGAVGFPNGFMAGAQGVLLQNISAGGSPDVRLTVRWSEFGFSE